MDSKKCVSRGNPCQGRGRALALFIIALPLVLGGWQIIMKKGLNPAYVDRIEDGKTKRTEILTLFGDPQETKRTPEGITYVYKAMRPKENSYSKKKKDDVTTAASVDSPFTLEENLKRKPKEAPVQEVSSILIINFKPDGETVMSHEFKQF
uniref:Lipoprotein SmpA/OmlA domain-containing protein n=1 Tax=Desulfobacca acetoxidans TaxID=60893 RepID=A0A7V6A5U5_9BACT